MSLNLENAVKYHYDKFPPKIDQFPLELINALLAASNALSRYDQMLKNIHNSELFLAPLRNQEAVISSRMEGTISTMDEILQYEADHDVIDDNDTNTNSDVIETLLYQRTLKSIQQSLSEGYPFSESLIKQAHQGLLSFGRGAEKSPGQFKTEQNYLADRSRKNILFIPISPELLPLGMKDLFEYINTSDHPALIKTAIAHVEFEALHPFKDGNGRIGRMLITLMLWRAGLISSPHFYISGYMEDNKDRYIDLMRNVSEQNNWLDWCIFFLEAIQVQAQKNLEMAESIKSLYEEMKGTLSSILNSKWSLTALDFIFINPIFRNNKFTQKSGIPAATAHKCINTLLEHGILQEAQAASGRRPAMYKFEKLLNQVRV